MLAEAAGVHYDEYSNLDAPLPVHATGGAALELEPGSAGIDWVDVLQADGADVLAAFADTELAAGAAVTSRAIGRGRVSYVGTVPNPALARSLARWLVPDRATERWAAGPTVTVSTGRSGDRRIAFVANWSPVAASVVAPATTRDLVTGEVHAAGAPIPLERRAAVVLEATDDSTE
jgi:beta-galactosidase